MPRFAVLLRGVNVGKGNRVPMAAFRSMLESLGYEQVKTLLNSGNAVFTSPTRSSVVHSRAIHAALQATLRLDVSVIVKSSTEIDVVLEDNDVAVHCDNPSRLLVAFAQESATLRSLSAVAPMVRPAERFTIGRHAAYLWCAGGILESRAASALLGRKIGAVTTRNWATVLKLAALLPPPDER